MKEKAIGKIIGGLLICLMFGLVFGGLIDTTSATSEKTTVSVTDSSPWFTKGSNSGHPELWYSHTYQGHNYISTYVGGMSGNPSQPDCWAEFKPYLSQSGKYEVYAYFYACKDTSTKVPFTVKYDGGSTTIKVNQYRSSPAWKEKYLGTWDFKAGADTCVKVTDATGEPYDGCKGLTIGAIKFMKKETVPTPVITGIDPSQPSASPTRQWITIIGTGFVSDSTVTLCIGSSTYPIPSDRTEFKSATQIRVYVGLTDPGTWTTRVTNPGNRLSNLFSFTVKQDIPTPAITGIDPLQPTVSPTRQWITIIGTGFVSDSTVTLRIGSSTYPIPSDRTEFKSATQIRVYVGLTDPGTWTARVTNPGNRLSNLFSFTVKQDIPSPVHDMAVTTVYTTPSSPNVGQTTTIYVTVKNEGNQQENNVPVKAHVDGSQVGSTQHVTLSAGKSTTKSFSWTPSTAKTYSVKGEIGVVSGETDTSDNKKTITVSVQQQNQPPTTPSIPSGTSSGYTGTSYGYSTSATDPNGDQVKYTFDWGEGPQTTTGFYNSGATATASHSWSNEGTCYVKVKATDSKGASSGWSSSKTVTIERQNHKPSAYLDSISPNPAKPGQTVSFNGRGTDPDGDSITGWNWRSSINGFLSSSKSFSKSDLSVGTHTIYFKVKDSHELWSDEATNSLTIERKNRKPTAYIDSISPNPAKPGQTVSFNGRGTDPDGDSITGWNWRSRINGFLSSSKSFSKSDLSVGTHTIYFKVKDSHGLWSDEVTKSLTIERKNRKPTAYIDSISPNPAKPGQTVSFNGRGTDPDGDSIAGWNWRSRINGFLSSSKSFSKSDLSVGTHTIYFKVKDSQGLWSDEATKSLTIKEPSTISIKIDDWSAEPREVKVGEKVTLKFKFTNTGNIPWTFYAALSLRRPDNTVDNSPLLKAVALAPTQQGSAEWTYTRDMQGKWDVVFGVWKEEAQKNSLGSTGWLEDIIGVAEVEHSEIPVLNWPLRGEIEDRRILLGFGDIWTWTYCGGLPKRHTGVDLKASVGEDVYAAYDGVVKAVYALSSKHNWGKGVVIEHSEFTTTYMHVNPVVNVGAHVNNGQKIAIIVNIDGDEHLHFGVRSGTYSAISKRGALPQKHGDSNYQEGRFTGCKSDPLFPEKFVDPMKLKYEIAIPVDSDGDGLTDEEELKYGTDLNKQDSDDDGFSDKLEVDLALEYKPILALSDGELFYPTKVGNFLNHSRLMKKAAKRMEGPPVSPESLEIYSTTEYYLDLAFGPDSDATGLDHAIRLWEEMLHANVTYTSVSKANIPYICMGKAEQYELISVQYWFFYIYNYHPQFPDHEGDWEHITVYLDNRSMKPVVVTYNRHHLSPELVKWNDLKRKVGNHPIVFVANGSHASYPDCGQMIVGGGYKFEKQILDCHWGEGPWINIQNLNVIMLQTQPWIYFKGKWGENIYLSPNGLMHTKYFRDPARELQEAGFDLTNVYS